MTIYSSSRTKNARQVKELASLYEKGVVGESTARTLNKALDFEVSHLQMQLDEIQRVMADYERQYGMKSAEFFKQFDAGQLGDRMDYVEWSGLYQMAGHLQKQVNKLSNRGKA